MKIRIQGNSIRLRLSQTEVREFGDSGRVSCAVQIGNLPQETLHYSIEKGNYPNIQAMYAMNEIRVLVPNQAGKEWADSETIGLENIMNLGNGHSLRILIEKDFQCLNPRTGEDDLDTFPNPNSQNHAC